MNLLSLGAEVAIASVIGVDEGSNKILSLMHGSQLTDDLIIRSKDRSGSVKSRYIADGQQMLRVDEESTDDIDFDLQDCLLGLISDSIQNFDSIIISDYGKGVCTPRLCEFVINLANKNEIKLLVDPKGPDFSKYRGAYTITPNRHEAEVVLGRQITTKEDIDLALSDLKQIYALDVAIITLSEDGIALLNEGVTLFPAQAHEVVDVTGAGDTVIASLALCLAHDVIIDEAITAANYLASIVVCQHGLGLPSYINLMERGYAAKTPMTWVDHKLMVLQALAQSCALLDKLFC